MNSSAPLAPPLATVTPDLSRAPAALSAPGHQIVGADVDRDECLAFNQDF